MRVAQLVTGMARMVARVTCCVGEMVRPVLLLLLLGHPLTGTLGVQWCYNGVTVVVEWCRPYKCLQHDQQRCGNFFGLDKFVALNIQCFVVD